LAQRALLHAQLAKLSGQRAKALGLLLANAKLLPSQLADALAKTLELLRLLAVNACSRLSGLIACLALLHHQVGNVLVDCRLLASQSTALRRHVAVLLRGLLVNVRCALAKLCLLHTQLTKALASTHLLLCQVAVQTGCSLAQLCLLRGLRAHLLADVGQLASACLPDLRALCFQGTDLRACLQA